jgi:hypothetical protein
MFFRRNSLRAALVSAVVSLLFVACNTDSPSTQRKNDIGQYPGKATPDMVSRGHYLVTVAGCNDCHSPKKFTPEGPVVDSARLLSGHPATLPVPLLTADALTPGSWMLMGPDLTTYVGPWGISYATNLTPDTTTGMGGWTEDAFVKTIRKGKHLGLDNGRPILPPMPWEEMAQWEDSDLRAVYRYLRFVTPIRNQVPPPVSPQDATKLAAKK